MHNDLCLINIFIMPPLQEDGQHGSMGTRVLKKEEGFEKDVIYHRVTRNQVYMYVGAGLSKR
jgi:hypothetical protein